MNCSALLPSVKVWRTQLVKLRFMLLCIWVTHVYAIVSNTAHLLTKGITGINKFVKLDTVLIFVFELYFMALIKKLRFRSIVFSQFIEILCSNVHFPISSLWGCTWKIQPWNNGCRNNSNHLQICLRIVYGKFNGTFQLLRNFIVRYLTH